MDGHRSPTLEYSPTSWFYLTVPSAPASEARLQAMDVYMNDLNFLAQGIPDQQRRVTDMVLQGIKDISPSLPTNIKDSIRLKNTQEGDGYWAVQKEILGWILNSEAGKFQLPSRRIKEFKALLDISPTRQCIAVPKLRSLIGKLRSMHLAVTGAITHFFYIQEALTKSGTGTQAYLSNAFHQEISHWQRLYNDSLAQPHFLE